jgi:tungstate transport system substrate-binding protein
VHRLVFATLLLCGAGAACVRPAPALILATTTSVGNSGLLDALGTDYERTRGIAIRSHLVGSGRALAMLASRDADVAITHAPAAEAAFLSTHPAWRYTKVMFNDFVLVGPAADPARAKGAVDAAAAMTRIAANGARFISRGDGSGTHEREQALWQKAGTRPSPTRTVFAGAGMGAALRIASETSAYTLTDRATFEQHAGGLALVILFENPAELSNTYAVLIDPEAPGALRAAAFAEWLAAGRGRTVIDGYRIKGGVRAFQVWPLSGRRGDPWAAPQ